MASFTVTQNTKLRVQPQEDAEVVERVPKDTVVEERPAPDGANSDTWLHVRYMKAAAVPFDGWLPRAVLTEGGEVALVAIDEERFATHAHHTSGAFNMPMENRAHPAIPDFMLALAAIVSGTQNVRQGGRVGPFGYEPATWAALVADAAAPAGYFGAGDAIENPYSQLAAAAVEMHRNGVAMTALHGAAGLSTAEDPFIPDYRSLLHSHLLGPEAAFALWQAAQPGAAAAELGALVAAARGIGAEEALALLKERPKPYFAGGDAAGALLGVAEFNGATEGLLNEAFAAARTVLLKYIPELRPTGGANWFEVAQSFKDRVTEAADGEQIKLFFEATDFGNEVDPNNVPHWCGAFAAHCMKEAGGLAAKSIVAGAARAEKWLAWGDRALPWAGEAVIPQGAVVVLSASENSGTSGHVGFFVSKTETHVTLLGGNQSDAVNETEFLIGKIAAVRWLEGAGARYNAEAIPAGRKDMADLIMARFAAAGFAPRHQIAALANAIAESKLDPEARRTNEEEDSVGLFQCNMKGGVGEPFGPEQLVDPEFNIKVIIDEALTKPPFVKAATLAAAVDAFVREVERPDNQDAVVAERTELANRLVQGT